VAYESRLELARIMLADFDPAVTAIAAQPFRLAGPDGAGGGRPVAEIERQTGAPAVLVRPAVLHLLWSGALVTDLGRAAGRIGLPSAPAAGRRELAGQPGDDRVRRDRAGQLRLPARHRDGGQAAAAGRDRCGQVRDDLPRVAGRPRRPPPGQPG
jgi:hypothetical protein